MGLDGWFFVSEIGYKFYIGGALALYYIGDFFETNDQVVPVSYYSRRGDSGGHSELTKSASPCVCVFAEFGKSNFAAFKVGKGFYFRLKQSFVDKKSIFLNPTQGKRVDGRVC